MKPTTVEWLRKADSDYTLAVSLCRRRRHPVRDHVCFHFQQSAEKFVKARLEEAGIRFPKTHDIASLPHLAAAVEPLWSALIPAARRLNDYGVKVRYPGNDATAKDAVSAHRDATAIRREVRLALGI